MNYDQDELMNRIAYDIEHSKLLRMVGVSNVNELQFTEAQYKYVTLISAYTAMFAIEEFNNMMNLQFNSLVDARIQEYLKSNPTENP